MKRPLWIVTFQVTVKMPEGVTVGDMRSHIKEAVEVWGWQYYPDHPLGPPCPLSKRGAVKVTVKRGAA